MTALGLFGVFDFALVLVLYILASIEEDRYEFWKEQVVHMKFSESFFDLLVRCHGWTARLAG